MQKIIDYFFENDNSVERIIERNYIFNNEGFKNILLFKNKKTSEVIRFITSECSHSNITIVYSEYLNSKNIKIKNISLTEFTSFTALFDFSVESRFDFFIKSVFNNASSVAKSTTISAGGSTSFNPIRLFYLIFFILSILLLVYKNF